MRPGEGSPEADAAHKVSPHRGPAAQERDALLRRRYEDGPLPSAAVVRAASASASPPRYVPLPTGCFHTWDSQRRQREAMAAQANTRSPSQEVVRQSKSPSASRERSPSRPLLSPAPHTETSPGYSDSGDAAAAVAAEPVALSPPPPPLPQQAAAPALGTRTYRAPTRTVSPSKRLLPIHNATAAKDASPISPPHHHHDGASPGSGSGGGASAASASPPPQVSTPPRFSPARSPARATARSCADPTAFTPYTPPRARPAPEARETAGAGAGVPSSSLSPQRTALRSRSVDTAGSPAAAAAAAATLRLVVSASDKWTTLPPQAWLVAPGERVLSLVRRCGLAEPDAPDTAFQGFTLRVPAKGVTWSSKTHRNVSVASLGLASGDEVVVTSTWATYRR